LVLGVIMQLYDLFESYLKNNIYVGDYYSFFADKYADKIKQNFDDNINCRKIYPQEIYDEKPLFINQFVVNEYKENKWVDVHKEPLFINEIRKDFWEIADSLGANLYDINIIRSCKTLKPSARGTLKKDGYASETWHWDNNPDFVFKIMIYLNDITEKQGPFEYKYPIEYKEHDNSDRNSRINISEVGKKVVGKKGTTIIFPTNIVHKGNYVRKGYRDVIIASMILPIGYRPQLQPRPEEIRT